MTYHPGPRTLPDFDVLREEEQQEITEATRHAERHHMGVRVKHRGLEIVAYPDPAVPAGDTLEEWDI